MYPVIVPDNAMRGIPLEPATVASVDNFVLAAVLLVLLLLGFNSKHVARIFASFFHDVWSIRERENVFDEHVAAETQTMLLLLLLTSVLEGFLLACFILPEGTGFMLPAFVVCAAASLGFNIFSVIACTTVGYTFTTSALALHWRRGLLSTQAMLGLILLIPTVVIIVQPALIKTGFTIGAILYITARLLYIAKGLRIFFNDYLSWLYFILYLCTLEIIPLVIIWRFVGEYSAMF